MELEFDGVGVSFMILSICVIVIYLVFYFTMPYTELIVPWYEPYLLLGMFSILFFCGLRGCIITPTKR